ncbi:GAF domain-containing protein [Paenibacillus yanchengensis]|uniref:GAF domain-containing protein n=1 Tax=Paenibacillus yanchengensis TaxID=2035833 RepID=A0ABW4YPP6_9BACL
MITTIESKIDYSLEYIRQQSSSDFIGLGVIDREQRNLYWSYVKGSVSARTLLIVQKLTGGLTGAAIRAGRPMKSSFICSDADRFRQGEPVMLTEKLDSALSLPVYNSNEITAILLLGRRNQMIYSSAEQGDAVDYASQLGELLVMELPNRLQ